MTEAGLNKIDVYPENGRVDWEFNMSKMAKVKKN